MTTHLHACKDERGCNLRGLIACPLLHLLFPFTVVLPTPNSRVAGRKLEVERIAEVSEKVCAFLRGQHEAHNPVQNSSFLPNLLVFYTRQAQLALER